MDPGIIGILGLALLFLGGVGYAAWKERKRRGLQIAEPPIWIQDGRQIEEPQKRKH